MNTQDKELLLKDLCARLPYGVIVHFDGWNPEKLTDIDLHTMVVNGMGGLPIPYLRPMSSMTEEERNDFILISDTVLRLGDKMSTCILSLEQMDWLNKNMFDYRDLIPMGLALEAKEGMYKTE